MAKKRPAYRLRQFGARLALELKLLRRFRGGARMRPALFIVGAQKAGTTSLFGHLAQHRQVLPPLVKEVHYFDVATARGERWYGAHFPTLVDAQTASAAAGSDVLTFDTTPYYMFHPDVAGRIKAYAPDAKIIFVLRDPVARAWSHYWHEYARSFEALPPVAALEAEATRLAAPHERVGGTAAERFAHQHYSYCARSEYDRQIARWQALFPPEQLLVLKSETLFSDPTATLARVADFLGIAPFGAVPNRSLNAGKYDDPPADAAAWLRRRLAASTKRTRAMLGSEFCWPS